MVKNICSAPSAACDPLASQLRRVDQKVEESLLLMQVDRPKTVVLQSPTRKCVMHRGFVTTKQEI